MKRSARSDLVEAKRKIENYTYPQKKRLNNPPVGLVTVESDRNAGKRSYAFDPHIDPTLQWAGKAEHTSFQVPTVSLHVHERIDPRSIIEAVRNKNGENFVQGSLFSAREENPPLREAVDFYRHKHNWSNRLVAGDSLLVMNSLLEKEGMAGKVQMVYIDPPYGISYGSNFQPFVNNRDVKDRKDEDLTAEPEMIKAFRDTWELGIHSYLSYLRDRLLLARELLHESGSIFVQISDENVHHVREILDEVFTPACHVVDIVVKKKGSQKSALMDPVNDYVVWYTKSPRSSGLIKFRPLFEKRELDSETVSEFNQVELNDGRQFPISAMPTPPNGAVFDYRLSPRRLFLDYPTARIFRPWPITNGGIRPNQMDGIELAGKTFFPPKGRCWSFRSKRIDNETISPMERLKEAGRLLAASTALDGKRYLDDFPYKTISNWWDGLGGASSPIYVVQTNPEIIKRCTLMVTDPGDLVLDITCGSGTTAYVAEQWGRRWIMCDTSRVALTLTKQRLMTAVFDYYQLAHEQEGVSSGFNYKTIPYVTLGSIANKEPPEHETLYDEPEIERGKVRVTGPFTVEAVPAPAVKALHEVDEGQLLLADASISRSGETRRQADWRDELLKTGIRGSGGQRIEFSRVEPLPGTRWLHADAETMDAKPQRVVISFGPDHAPLEQRQVELALDEAEKLRPKPTIVVFAAFQFDPEAAKDIAETNWGGVTLLTAQMNADLLTEDLKKKRASNESFWLIGQPDIDVEQFTKGEHQGKYQVTVNGFDYYNTETGNIESGGPEKIAMWLLDTDYDGRSLFPRQVFFPIASESDGWTKLAKNLKAEIDESLIEAYRGMTSLPFEVGKHKTAAVKIIDARGIESLKLIDLE
jgi:adenine-specific DNA-methyltransferase